MNIFDEVYENYINLETYDEQTILAKVNEIISENPDPGVIIRALKQVS